MEKPAGIDSILRSEELAEHGLRFAGIGATKLVFETEASTDKLIKVDRFDLREELANRLALGKEVPSSDYEGQKARFAAYKALEDELADHFGEEHILRKGSFRYNVPITKETATLVLGSSGQKLIDKMGDDEVIELKMVIETQVRAPELEDKESYDTSDIHIPLIRYSEYLSSDDMGDRLHSIESIVDKNLDGIGRKWKEAGLAEPAKAAVSDIISYTKKTGRMIDLFGGFNVTLFREDGVGSYHLIDPLLPGSAQHWEMRADKDRDHRLMRHYYSYLYGVNKLAEELGLDDRLDMNDLVYFKGSGLSTPEDLLASPSTA